MRSFLLSPSQGDAVRGSNVQKMHTSTSLQKSQRTPAINDAAVEVFSYACGNTPEVGDLIEFGTRHKRYLILAIDEEGPHLSITYGTNSGNEATLKLMRLIARHGEVVT